MELYLFGSFTPWISCHHVPSNPCLDGRCGVAETTSKTTWSSKHPRKKNKQTKTHIQNFSGSWFIQSSKPSNSHENGYGSIPINTIFNGMNIHLPAILGFTRYQGFDPSQITQNHQNQLVSRRVAMCWTPMARHLWDWQQAWHGPVGRPHYLGVQRTRTTYC